MKLWNRLMPVFAIAVLTGCPSSNNPDTGMSNGDGNTVTDATLDALTDTGTSNGDASAQVAQVCAQVVAHDQMCHARQCEIDDVNAQCTALFASLRPEALARVGECAMNAPCPDPDSGTSTPSCNIDLSTLTPTDAQRQFVMAACMACPEAGGADAGVSDCIAHAFDISDGGQANGIGGLPLLFNDAAIARMTTCVNALSTTDAGIGGCGFAVFECELAVIGSTQSSCDSGTGGMMGMGFNPRPH